MIMYVPDDTLKLTEIKTELLINSLVSGYD